jgi:2'-5' RNA ligase
VLWAGLGGDDGGFARLATGLDDALSDEFPPERRPFHPHLTVARSDPPVPLPPAFAETALASDPWEVDHVVLFRSHLRRPAARYEPLDRSSLRG